MEREAEDALVRLVPEHLQNACRRYVEDHCPTGHFLRAVLINDLREAVARADEKSLTGLRGIVQWFYNYTPGTCYGSAEKVETWLSGRRGTMCSVD